MAIIIVAIALTLIVICGYISYRIKNVREEEKGFYDILLLTKFFLIIAKNGKWDTFIRENSIIYVTRNILITTTDIDFNALNIEKNNYFEIMTDANISNILDTKKCYLWYEFKTDIETISFAVKVSIEHRNLLNFLKNTVFICSVDKNKVKMLLNGSVEKVMYISSIESICQNLAFVLQNKEINFKEKKSWFLGFLPEIQETYNVIANIKEVLSNNDNGFQKRINKK